MTSGDRVRPRAGLEHYSVVSPTDERYPAQLTALLAEAPVYAIGNVDLARRPAIGICGSRSATDNAVGYAAEFGYAAAKEGFVVVSGYARGVDAAAHGGALEAGGATIAVLAEGIRDFHVKTELRAKLDWTRFLAVSTFAPEASWAVWRAMKRNKYIVALSRGLFVIEAREKGGTFEAGLECLRQRKPLWVIDYERGGQQREGNGRLIAAGGVPVRNRPELNRLLQGARELYPPTQGRLALRVAEG